MIAIIKHYCQIIDSLGGGFHIEKERIQGSCHTPCFVFRPLRDASRQISLCSLFGDSHNLDERVSHEKDRSERQKGPSEKEDESRLLERRAGAVTRRVDDLQRDTGIAEQGSMFFSRDWQRDLIDCNIELVLRSDNLKVARSCIIHPERPQGRAGIGIHDEVAEIMLTSDTVHDTSDLARITPPQGEGTLAGGEVCHCSHALAGRLTLRRGDLRKKREVHHCTDCRHEGDDDERKLRPHRKIGQVLHHVSRHPWCAAVLDFDSIISLFESIITDSSRFRFYTIRPRTKTVVAPIPLRAPGHTPGFPGLLPVDEPPYRRTIWLELHANIPNPRRNRFRPDECIEYIGKRKQACDISQAGDSRRICRGITPDGNPPRFKRRPDLLRFLLHPGHHFSKPSFFINAINLVSFRKASQTGSVLIVTTTLSCNSYARSSSLRASSLSPATARFRATEKRPSKFENWTPRSSCIRASPLKPDRVYVCLASSMSFALSPSATIPLTSSSNAASGIPFCR